MASRLYEGLIPFCPLSPALRLSELADRHISALLQTCIPSSLADTSNLARKDTSHSSFEFITMTCRLPNVVVPSGTTECECSTLENLLMVKDMAISIDCECLIEMKTPILASAAMILEVNPGQGLRRSMPNRITSP